jgi:hypothetical protein
MEIFLTKPEASEGERNADLDFRMMSQYLCLALAELFPATKLLKEKWQLCCCQS